MASIFSASWSFWGFPAPSFRFAFLQLMEPDTWEMFGQSSVCFVLFPECFEVVRSERVVKGLTLHVHVNTGSTWKSCTFFMIRVCWAVGAVSSWFLSLLCLDQIYNRSWGWRAVGLQTHELNNIVVLLYFGAQCKRGMSESSHAKKAQGDLSAASEDHHWK